VLVPAPNTFPAAVWVKYLTVFVVVGIAGFILILSYQLRIIGCSGYGYGPDAYLAQCALKTYGDYEHGALGLQIDKRAIDHLERAQVVILGHSHAMVGFSAPPTRQYFATKGIQFYNASLSGEYGGFFDFFLARVRLRASVLVIDVAPFFTGDIMSPTGQFIVEHPTRAAIEYRIKQIWQTIHRHGCSTIRPLKRLLCGNTFSIFRSVTDGWLVVDYTLAYGSPLPKLPVTQSVHVPAEIELRIKLAEQFLARHHLNPGCTILTAIPTGGDFSDSAQSIAQALHVPYINPSIDGLTTIDGAHLDMPSATAWSHQFWREATRIIDQCLK
jgi:hypothetical protein